MEPNAREVRGESPRPGAASCPEPRDLAWATDEPTFAYATGETGALRLTMVFGRSGAGWLLLHLHASIGVPNGEIFRGG